MKGRALRGAVADDRLLLKSHHIFRSIWCYPGSSVLQTNKSTAEVGKLAQAIWKRKKNAIGFIYRRITLFYVTKNTLKNIILVK